MTPPKRITVDASIVVFGLGSVGALMFASLLPLLLGAIAAWLLMLAGVYVKGM